MTVKDRLAGYTKTQDRVAEDVGGGAPFLHSYYAKSDGKTAQLVREKAPSVKSGEPVIVAGGEVHVIRDADDTDPSRFVLLGPFQRYYARRKESNLSLITAQEKRKTGGKRKGETAWREEVIAVMALLGHGDPIPFFARVEKHRCRFLVSANNAVADSGKKDPRQITHEIVLEPGGKAGGFSYLIWDADSSPTTPEDLKAAMEGIDSDALEEVLDRFDEELEALDL